MSDTSSDVVTPEDQSVLTYLTLREWDKVIDALGQDQIDALGLNKNASLIDQIEGNRKALQQDEIEPAVYEIGDRVSYFETLGADAGTVIGRKEVTLFVYEVEWDDSEPTDEYDGELLRPLAEVEAIYN